MLLFTRFQNILICIYFRYIYYKPTTSMFYFIFKMISYDKLVGGDVCIRFRLKQSQIVKIVRQCLYLLTAVLPVLTT